MDELSSKNGPNGTDEQSKKRGVREVSEVQTGADKKKRKFKHPQNEDKIKALSHKNFAEQSKKKDSVGCEHV